MKKLTNKVSELNRKTRERLLGSKPAKIFFRKNKNPPVKSTQSSNVNFNIEELGMENYCTFHQEAHSEKTCPQWIHNMIVVVTKVFKYQTIVYDEEESNDPEEEATPPDENVGSDVLVFEVICGGEVQSVQEVKI